MKYEEEVKKFNGLIMYPNCFNPFCNKFKIGKIQEGVGKSKTENLKKGILYENLTKIPKK